MSRRSGFWFGNPIYTFTNAEAAAVVAQMAVQPSNARKALIDTLVGGFKSAGLWAASDAIYVPFAHAEQAARLNWKIPSGTPLSGGSSFVADAGWSVGNIDTQVNVNTWTQFQQNAARVGFYSTVSLVSGNHFFASAASYSTSFGIDAVNKSFSCNTAGGGGGTSTTALANALGIGAQMMHGVTRGGSTVHQVWGATNSGASNVNGTVSSVARGAGSMTFFQPNGKCLMFIGNAMSDGAMSSSVTHIRNYLNGL